MSVYEVRYVKASRRNRRCIGCENFVTIEKGNPYYSCFYADGGDCGRYSLCVPCHDHLNECKECQEAAENGEWHVRECRIEFSKEASRETNH